MIVKTLKILLMMFVLLTITNCSCTPEIKYEKVPYEVKVPVKMKLPKVYCDFNRSTDTEVISSMLECIIKQKRVMEPYQK